MGVAMMPGRRSKTPMPWGARRRAMSWAAIAVAALEMQYSARSGEARVAETEVMKIRLW